MVILSGASALLYQIVWQRLLILLSGRVVQTDFARLGRHVGLLLVANIAGSAAGTWATPS